MTQTDVDPVALTFDFSNVQGLLKYTVSVITCSLCTSVHRMDGQTDSSA